MDRKEIQKLEQFFRTKFKLPTIEIRQRPRKDGSAEVFIGDEFIGVLFRDEDEGELSYNFRMVIDLGAQAEVLPIHLTSYLKRKFDNENIRVVARPKKQDSLEVFIGEEFIAVLFVEIEKNRRIFILELPILDVDLAG